MCAGERGIVEEYDNRISTGQTPIYRVRHDWGPRLYYWWKVTPVSALEQLAEAVID